MRKATVKKDPVNPEPTEIIAKAIIEVASAFQKINKGPLSQRAIILLLQDSMPPDRRVSQKDIKLVLDYLPELKQFVKKPIS
jgi:hypothetical protein